ncbi:hypothetical protein BYT27DRAFT_6397915 [Phlegmacium glaucopus]|nr:hypothetical protein BYT27DRAFT_6397915 [Phlegmacium glaucopus]
MLYSRISKGAFHNSAEREDQPKCLPGTRKVIIEQIMDWVHGADGEEFLMWLHGPMDAGKSALAQTIAELSSKEKLLAASFFFDEGVLDRNNKTRFIPTLVYQFAWSIKEMCVYIQEAIAIDPAIFDRNLSTQVTNLIINPLKKAFEADGGSRLIHRKVVIIDGLDQCAGSRDQQNIIDVLSKAASELKPRLLILLTSRPELPIREAFNQLPQMIISIALDVAYTSRKDVESLPTSRHSRSQPEPVFEDSVPQPSKDMTKKWSLFGGRSFFSSNKDIGEIEVSRTLHKRTKTVIASNPID